MRGPSIGDLGLVAGLASRLARDANSDARRDLKRVLLGAYMGWFKKQPIRDGGKEFRRDGMVLRMVQPEGGKR